MVLQPYELLIFTNNQFTLWLLPIAFTELIKERDINSSFYTVCALLIHLASEWLHNNKEGMYSKK